jgi:membrane protein
MGSFTIVEWKTFFARLYDKVFETDLLNRAAQVAFYFSFSLFPLLYFLITLFGLVLGSTRDLENEIFNYLRQIMPGSAFEIVRRTVIEVIEGSTGAKLTFGLAVTLWSASVGIDGIRSALNDVYQLRETRPWWRTKIHSLILTLLSIILIATALAIVFYGWQLVQIGLNHLDIQVRSAFILVAIQWAAILIVMLLACEVIYNLLPDYREFQWKWVTPGSIVAIILWIILTTGFRVYLDHFNTYNRTYGSLGAVMILMLWFYLTAVVVLLGGAINSVRSEMSKAGADPDRSQEAK